MKVAITDYSFPNLDIEEDILRSQGHRITAWKEKRTAAELRQLVADADAVITQFAPITADVINSMRQATVIVRYGIGVDNVDLEAAKSRGIPVCNVPAVRKLRETAASLAAMALRGEALPNVVNGVGG